MINKPGRNGGTLQYWEKGETGNPNGQPRKGISLINKELEEMGYEPVKKRDIEINFMSLLQLGEEELKNFLNDKSKPMLVRILAKNMLGGKSFDIVEKMLDRGIGKPTQKVENENSIVLNTISEEDRKLLEKVIAENI